MFTLRVQSKKKEERRGLVGGWTVALPIIPLAPFTTSTPPPPPPQPLYLPSCGDPSVHAHTHALTNGNSGFERRRSILTPRCTLVITRARSHTRLSRPHILYGSRNVRQRTRAPQFNTRRRARNWRWHFCLFFLCWKTKYRFVCFFKVNYSYFFWKFQCWL